MQYFLNGYWDILPVFDDNLMSLNIKEITELDFLEGIYKVPSVFSIPDVHTDIGIFKSFNYPDKWNRTRNACFKRVINFSHKDIEEYDNILITFKGILGKSEAFINGKKIFENFDPGLPVSKKINEYIEPGPNELLVKVTDLPTDEEGKYLYPNGGFVTHGCSGIWQDVYIEKKNKIYIEDFFYTASYRDKKINFRVNISNCLDEFNGTLKLSLKYDENLFNESEVSIKNKENNIYMISIDGEEIHYWSSADPSLYDMTLYIFDEKGEQIDALHKKIGFKEVWIEDESFYINGIKTHFYGDWGHRIHVYQQKPEYIRAWFGMIKDLGMNYVRLHTGPHDPIVYEIANEMGIYICGETGLFASCGLIAPKHDIFWENSYSHVRRFIERDKNEVSLVLWSAGNEMRWASPVDMVIKNMPKVGKIINDIDPSRPVYYEGDSSLWDESKQSVISRHYGMDVTGEDWWDKKVPLHIGELGKWHYGQPPENVMLGGNTTYESLEKSHYFVGLEAALLIERARINDVSSIFPWNISCLDNPSLPEERVELNWENENEPGVKPDFVSPYSCEFNWWDRDKPSYNKGPSFDLIKEALEPETFFIWERQREYFKNDEIKRRITVINDTEKDNKYILKIDIRGENHKDDRTFALSLKAGERKTINFNYKSLDNDGNKIEFIFNLLKDTIPLKTQNQKITLIQKAKTFENMAVQVVGDGSLSSYFELSQCPYEYKEKSSEFDINKILIIEKESAVHESWFVKKIMDFVASGGKILLMEQYASIFTDMEIQELELIKVHSNDEVFDDLSLEWWGEDSYMGTGGKDYVCLTPYTKSKRGNIKSLIDAGTGDFGRGGLDWTCLFEYEFNRGIILVNAMEITKNYNKIPSAKRILDRMISRLKEFSPSEKKGVFLSDSLLSNPFISENIDSISENLEKADIYMIDLKDIDNIKKESILKAVYEGKQAILTGINDNNIDFIEKITGEEVELIKIGDDPQGIIVKKDKTVEGMTNSDVFWMNHIVYAKADLKNYPISNGYAIKSKSLNPVISIVENRAFFDFIEIYKSLELYRSKMFSLYRGIKREGTLLGSIRYGKGNIILSQIRIPFNEEIKSRVFMEKFLLNLGCLRDKNLFNLNEIKKLNKNYPTCIYLWGNYQDSTYSSLVNIKKNKERMDVQSEISIDNPIKLENENGQFDISDGKRSIMLHYVISRRTRKLTGTLGGLPNPSHTLILEVKGMGGLELFINGKRVFHGVVNESGVNVPEIELKKGLNTVLAVYNHPVKKSDISFLWKNNNKKRETELEFVE